MMTLRGFTERVAKSHLKLTFYDNQQSNAACFNFAIAIRGVLTECYVTFVPTWRALDSVYHSSESTYRVISRKDEHVRMEILGQKYDTKGEELDWFQNMMTTEFPAFELSEEDSITIELDNFEKQIKKVGRLLREVRLRKMQILSERMLFIERNCNAPDPSTEPKQAYDYWMKFPIHNIPGKIHEDTSHLKVIHVDLHLQVQYLTLQYFILSEIRQKTSLEHFRYFQECELPRLTSNYDALTESINTATTATEEYVKIFSTFPTTPDWKIRETHLQDAGKEYHLIVQKCEECEIIARVAAARITRVLKKLVFHKVMYDTTMPAELEEIKIKLKEFHEKLKISRATIVNTREILNNHFEKVKELLRNY